MGADETEEREDGMLKDSRCLAPPGTPGTACHCEGFRFRVSRATMTDDQRRKAEGEMKKKDSKNTYHMR